MREMIAKTIYEHHVTSRIPECLRWDQLSAAAKAHWLAMADAVLIKIEIKAEENLVPVHWLRAA